MRKLCDEKSDRKKLDEISREETTAPCDASLKMLQVPADTPSTQQPWNSVPWLIFTLDYIRPALNSVQTKCDKILNPLFDQK